MALNGKLVTTPKLRFPEFLDSPEWEIKQLSVIAENLDNKRVPITENERTKGDVPYYGASGIVDYVNDYLFDEDLLCVSEDGANLVARTYPIAFPIAGKTWVNNHAHVLRFDKPARQKMVEDYLNSTDLRGFITGMAQPKLNRAMLDIIPIPMPEPGEQQRIADCLSSLDACVATQGRKVEALKAHKQGLMQELFPREGENLPRLRFPEFRNARGWEDRKLGSMANKIGSGITPLGGDKTYTPTGRPFIRSQNVGWGRLLLDDVAFIDEETHASFDGTEVLEDDVLLNITGASIGRSAVADARIVGGNVNQHVCIIRVNRGELKPNLLNQFLISERGQAQINSFQAGGNRQGLNFGQIRTFEIPLPPTKEEQQRIADCLFTLDSRIAAEFRMLDALKTHKKGLMQQLFPYPEEEL